MFFHHHQLTTALHSKLNGSLADQWLKAAAQVSVQQLAEELLLLDTQEQAARFVELAPRVQQELATCLDPVDLAALVEQMRPIARRRVLKQLPLNKLAQIFGQLPLTIRNTALRSLNRPKQLRFWAYRDACRRPFDYHSHASTLSVDATVEQALERYYSAAQHSHYLYVTDQQGALCGVLSGQMLTNIRVKMAPVGLFMQRPDELILPDHDADYVATRLKRFQRAELPVVNYNGRLLGVVDIDCLE